MAFIRWDYAMISFDLRYPFEKIAVWDFLNESRIGRWIIFRFQQCISVPSIEVAESWTLRLRFNEIWMRRLSSLPRKWHFYILAPSTNIFTAVTSFLFPKEQAAAIVFHRRKMKLFSVDCSNNWPSCAGCHEDKKAFEVNFYLHPVSHIDW
jgi:hypothetical protein